MMPEENPMGVGVQRIWMTVKEWTIPVVFATPFIAWYIYLDHYPSLWGWLGFQGALGALMGGVVLGSAMMSAPWDEWDEEDATERSLWPWIGVGAVGGAWMLIALPLLFESDVGEVPRWLDGLVRVPATVLPSALALWGLWRPIPWLVKALLWGAAMALVPAIWLTGTGKLTGALVALGVWVLLALLGWLQRRGA